MANTKSLSKDERKKAKRTARKKRKAEKPLGKRTVRPWIGQAQSQEDGTWHVEALVSIRQEAVGSVNNRAQRSGDSGDRSLWHNHR